MSEDLRQVVLGNVSAVRAESLRAHSGWDEALREGIAEAQAAWPDIRMSAQDIAREIAARVEKLPAETDLALWLEGLHHSDLYLALGCARGIREALVGFEKHFQGELRGVVKRFEGPRFATDDLKQVLRERLFVGTSSAAPKILAYSGQGSLRRWFVVTSTRLLLDQVRVGAQHKRESAPLHEEILNVAGEGDWEIEFLKREYRKTFKEAIATALGELSSQERNLLRLHLVERLSIDQIGVVFNVHRATAARRLERARESLMRSARDAMMRKLQIGDDDLDSIIRLVNSRLEASVHRILEEDDDGPPR